MTLGYLPPRHITSYGQEQRISSCRLVPMGSSIKAVGLSGDHAIAGSYRSAFIFERSGATWNEVAKLLFSDGGESRSFGNALAISEDVAVVGDPFDSRFHDRAGTAYVYEKSDSVWSEVARLYVDDAAPNDRFGTSVAIDNDQIIIGAEGKARVGTEAGTLGAACVFERSDDGWTETAKIVASDGENGDQFGSSVAISEDRIVVGAFFDGLRVGAAYVFDRSGDSWDEVLKLYANDADLFDLFGNAVALSGNQVVIGATDDDDLGGASGSAYVFFVPKMTSLPEPSSLALLLVGWMVLSIAVIKRSLNSP